MEHSNLTLTARIASARFAYEYLGQPLTTVADKFKLPLASVQREALESNWECVMPPSSGTPSPLSIPLDTNTPQPNVRADVGAPSTCTVSSPHVDALLEVTRLHTDITEAYRVREHVPLLAAIERAILLKIHTAVEALDVTDPILARSATQAMKVMYDITQSIHDKVPSSFVPAKADDASNQPNWSVNIQNNIQ